MVCAECKTQSAVTIRPSTRERLCKACFTTAIESTVHETLQQENILDGVKVLALGVSGGKDSTVLAHIMNQLKQKHKYNIELKLLCMDEGIKGYRDKAIEVVKQNEKDLNIPLTILSYKEEFSYTMDEIVAKKGTKRSCTYCGVLRRSSLEEAAKRVNADMVATGHNADDTAETVLMNYLRGDIRRLYRCTEAVTPKQANSTIESGTEKELSINNLSNSTIRRCKPLLRVYEKEIVLYAFYNALPYFSTECSYSVDSFRGVVRTYIKALERETPQAIKRIIKAGDIFRSAAGDNTFTQGGGTFAKCKTCGKSCAATKTSKSPDTQQCSVCVLLNGL